MKKLLSVVMITLALNFLAAVGGIAYLFQTGALTKEKIATIKQLIGPATTQGPTTEEKKDEPDASTQPTLRLETLLAKVSGRPAGEQVEAMQRSFDAEMAQIDRREREVQGMRREVENLKASLDVEVAALAERQKKLDAREKTLQKDTTDKGFTDSMALLDEMQTKDAKSAIAGMDDATAVKYLRAMEPSRAAKIMKEFKTPAEAARVLKIMEMIRGSQAEAKTN